MHEGYGARGFVLQFFQIWRVQYSPAWSALVVMTSCEIVRKALKYMVLRGAHLGSITNLSVKTHFTVHEVDGVCEASKYTALDEVHLGV